MDDDRLVLESLRSVCHAVDILPYCKVKEIKKNETTAKLSLKCQDDLNKKEFSVQATHLISCVGPWTDELGKVIDPSWSHKMRPSKGVHLCIKKSKLNLKTALVMAADKSKRILFCIPRKDFDIIGTTDTDYKKRFGSSGSDQKRHRLH